MEHPDSDLRPSSGLPHGAGIYQQRSPNRALYLLVFALLAIGVLVTVLLLRRV